MTTPSNHNNAAQSPIHLGLENLAALNLNDSFFNHFARRGGASIEDARNAKEMAKKIFADSPEVGIIAFARRDSGYILKIQLRSEPSDPNFRSDYATISGVPVEFVVLPDKSA